MISSVHACERIMPISSLTYEIGDFAYITHDTKIRERKKRARLHLEQPRRSPPVIDIFFSKRVCHDNAYFSTLLIENTNKGIITIID